MVNKKKSLGGYRLFFLALFLILLNFYSITFATNTWDLTTEKFDYLRAGRYMSKLESGARVNFEQWMFEDEFTDNLFSGAKLALEATSYNQEDYPYLTAVCVPQYNVIMLVFSDNITFFNYDSVQIGNRIWVDVNYDSSNHIITNTAVYSGTNTQQFLIQPVTYNHYSHGIYLSNYYPSESNPASNQVTNLWLGTRSGFIVPESLTYEVLMDTNLSYKVAEYYLGFNFDSYTYNVYYIDENENQVSVNNYVTPTANTYWWGNTISLYVQNENKQYLPNNTDFYITLDYTPKASTGIMGQGQSKHIIYSDVYKFSTINSVIPIPSTTPTQVPTSSPTASIDTINAGINEINSNLTTVPDISNVVINSGDIENSLGFELMADPYENFWFSLITGLSNCLTDDSYRSLDIDTPLGHIDFDLDEINFTYPTSIRILFTSMSTVCVVWAMIRWWKIIVDKLTSGGIDEVLAMNEEERHC